MKCTLLYCFGPLINNTWTTKNNSDVENLSQFMTPVNRNPSTERFVTDRWVLMTASTAPIRAIFDSGARFIFAARSEKTRTLEFLRVLHLARDGEDDTRNTVKLVGTPNQNKQLSRTRPNAAEARPEGCRVRWTPLVSRWRSFSWTCESPLQRVNRVPRRALDSLALDFSWSRLCQKLCQLVDNNNATADQQ